jgi:hypothetical protein
MINNNLPKKGTEQYDIIEDVILQLSYNLDHLSLSTQTLKLICSEFQFDNNQPFMVQWLFFLLKSEDSRVVSRIFRFIITVMI